jgi:hypothetical protein
MRRYSRWLRAGQPRDQSLSAGRINNILHVAQTGSEVHPASHRKGTEGSFSGMSLIFN